MNVDMPVAYGYTLELITPEERRMKPMMMRKCTYHKCQEKPVYLLRFMRRNGNKPNAQYTQTQRPCCPRHAQQAAERYDLPLPVGGIDE